MLVLQHLFAIYTLHVLYNIFELLIFEYNFMERRSKQITNGSSHGLQSTWLNDGRHIIYTERTNKGATRLMIMDTELEGAQAKPLHGSNFGNCSQASFFYSK